MSDPTYEGSIFGFTIETWDRYGYVDEVWQQVGIETVVYLPHQCGDWMISGPSYSRGMDTEDFTDKPVEALEAFIVEAQEALAAVRGMEGQ